MCVCVWRLSDSCIKLRPFPRQSICWSDQECCLNSLSIDRLVFVKFDLSFRLLVTELRCQSVAELRDNVSNIFGWQLCNQVVQELDSSPSHNVLVFPGMDSSCTGSFLESDSVSGSLGCDADSPVVVDLIASWPLYSENGKGSSTENKTTGGWQATEESTLFSDVVLIGWGGAGDANSVCSFWPSLFSDPSRHSWNRCTIKASTSLLLQVWRVITLSWQGWRGGGVPQWKRWQRHVKHTPGRASKPVPKQQQIL